MLSSRITSSVLKDTASGALDWEPDTPPVGWSVASTVDPSAEIRFYITPDFKVTYYDGASESDLFTQADDVSAYTELQALIEKQEADEDLQAAESDFFTNFPES